jgi:multidrug resistance efflux pump
MQTASTAPQAPHVDLAQRWAESRSRLFDARAAASRASADLDEAERAETQAWTDLQNEAGRGAPCSPTPVSRR